MTKPKFHKSPGVWSGFVPNETYGFSMCLVWPADNKKLHAFLKQMFPGCEGAVDPEEKTDWVGRAYEVRNPEFKCEVHVVALGEWRGKPLHHSALVHECFHVVHQALGTRGLTLTDESVEAYCYLLDSLVSQGIKILNHKPKKKAKK